MYGVLADQHAQQAVIVCSGDFTEDARRFGAGKPIRLVDGEALLALVQAVRAVNDTAARSPDPVLPDRSDSQLVCPRCGGRLVARTAKRGDRAGHRFLGCETFPRCRHIENLPTD